MNILAQWLPKYCLNCYCSHFFSSNEEIPSSSIILSGKVSHKVLFPSFEFSFIRKNNCKVCIKFHTANSWCPNFYSIYSFVFTFAWIRRGEGVLFGFLIQKMYCPKRVFFQTCAGGWFFFFCRIKSMDTRNPTFLLHFFFLYAAFNFMPQFM